MCVFSRLMIEGSIGDGLLRRHQGTEASRHRAEKGKKAKREASTDYADWSRLFKRNFKKKKKKKGLELILLFDSVL